MHMKSVVGLLMAVYVASSYSAYLPPAKQNAVNRETVNSVLLYGLRSTINHCSMQKDVSQCIKKYMLKVLDNAVHNKDDWVMNEYISLKKNPEFAEVQVVSEEGRSFEDTVEQKLENLFESRLFQLSFANQKSEGENFEEARKKEKKPKKGMMGMMDSGMGMMMMGKGMLLMSLISKMFYGKVALLAVSAFIFSKIALMLSALVALKKLMMGGKGGGSGGDSQQHIVYKAQEVSHQDSYGPPAGGSGSYGGGHSSGNGGGWGRTFQEITPNGDELAYNGHDKSA